MSLKPLLHIAEESETEAEAINPNKVPLLPPSYILLAAYKVKSTLLVEMSEEAFNKTDHHPSL
jgi:hypothetical protein